MWKKVTPANGGNVKTYYYLRNAQGNVMANYQQYTAEDQTLFVATEHPMYGSSRIGVDNRIDTMYKNGTYNPAWYTNNKSIRNLGLKSFELSNHLGNVLVTVSDKKVYTFNGANIVFEPEITTISDYYPFGSAINTRSYSSGAYRYGFQAQEKDDELWGEGNGVSYKYRIHDTRLGRFLSVDPLLRKYPWNSNYAFSENRVIDGIDLEGLEFTQYLQKDKLEERINSLIANPMLIEQIGGTCVIAAVTYLWILKNPEGFKKAVMDLYETGEANVGNYTINPDDHLEEVDIINNNEVYNGNGANYQADWLILSSLQDNLNCCIDFDGTDDDAWDFGNSMSEGASLLDNLGIYKKVSVQRTIFLSANLKMTLFDQLSKTGDLILSIDASLLQKNNSGRHAVTYVKGSHSTYEKDGKTFHKFKVQTWGRPDGIEIDASEEDLDDKINNEFIYGTNE